jgi:hypothetical protein
MTITALNLQQDATGGTTTGGSSIPLSSDGVAVKNGVHVADMTEADFTLRTNMSLRTRNPVRNVDGSYTKAKRYITIVVPKDLGDDGVVFNLVRIEIEAHPKTTEAELTNLHMLGAQMFTDSDLADFRMYGSLA